MKVLTFIQIREMYSGSSSLIAVALPTRNKVADATSSVRKIH